MPAMPSNRIVSRIRRAASLMVRLANPDARRRQGGARCHLAIDAKVDHRAFAVEVMQVDRQADGASKLIDAGDVCPSVCGLEESYPFDRDAPCFNSARSLAGAASL